MGHCTAVAVTQTDDRQAHALTFVVEAVMPVDAYTIRIGSRSFFLSKMGASSVLWKRSTPPKVAAVLSIPLGVP